MIRKICYSDLALLSNDILKNVNMLIEHGADKVELLMDGDKWDQSEMLFPQISSKLKDLSVEYTIHPPAWDINLTSENKAIREASYSEYLKAIQFALFSPQFSLKCIEIVIDKTQYSSYFSTS